MSLSLRYDSVLLVAASTMCRWTVVSSVVSWFFSGVLDIDTHIMKLLRIVFSGSTELLVNKVVGPGRVGEWG